MDGRNRLRTERLSERGKRFRKPEFEGKYWRIGEKVLEKTFKERYLSGEIEFEEIDEYCFQWGNSDDTRTLREYLGLNAEEEDAWVSVSEDALRVLLDGQKVR